MELPQPTTRNVAGFDADLVEYVLDALSHEIAQTNNRLNLVTVRRQVVRQYGRSPRLDRVWLRGDLVGDPLVA